MFIDILCQIFDSYFYFLLMVLIFTFQSILIQIQGFDQKCQKQQSLKQSYTLLQQFSFPLMELQKASNLNIDPNRSVDKFFFEDLHNYINLSSPSLMTNKYFTQLNIISDYVQLLSEFSLKVLSQSRNFHFQVNKRQVDEECHVLLIKIQVDNVQFNWKVLLIQMDKIIKVDLKYFDLQTHKFVTLDSFWFKYSLYLNQKISNTYKFISLKQMDKTIINPKIQLNSLFISRLLQSLARNAPQVKPKLNQQSDSQKNLINHIKIITHFDHLRFFNPSEFVLLGQHFYETSGTSENFLKICSFLTIKQIAQLKLVSRFIKNYLVSSEKELFKQLYECTYGKTGFEINEMNWSKLLDKKRGQKIKQRYKNPLIMNQGIFRTH